MKFNEYNKFSKQYEKVLKPGEYATYRLLNIKENDPDNPGKPLIPAAVMIPSTDKIYDKKVEDFVDIAFLDRPDKDGEAEFGNIVFTRAGLGILHLNGNNAMHRKMYQFMEICNFNASNEDRNPQEGEPIFYKVDAKREAKEERTLRRLVVSAVNRAMEMKDDKIMETALALGLNVSGIEEARNKVEEFAEMDPEEFFELIQRASLEAESILKKAMQEGIIRNNINACQFEWIPIGEEPVKVIHTYTKSTDRKFDYIKDFAESLLETNPDELKAIKSRLG